MSDLMRWADGQGVEPLAPAKLTWFEHRQNGRLLTRLENKADLQARAADLEAQVGQAKVHAVANVGNAAMTAQALISGRERLLVEAEPAAVHGVAYVSQKLTMALGAVVDETMHKVTR